MLVAVPGVLPKPLRMKLGHASRLNAVLSITLSTLCDRVDVHRRLQEVSESRPGRGRVDAESCLVGGVALGSLVCTDVDDSIRWQLRCAVWLRSCVGRSHVRQSSLISVYVDLFEPIGFVTLNDDCFHNLCMNNIPVAQRQIASLVEEQLSLREGFVTFDCGNFF